MISKSAAPTITTEDDDWQDWQDRKEAEAETEAYLATKQVYEDQAALTKRKIAWLIDGMRNMLRSTERLPKGVLKQHESLSEKMNSNFEELHKLIASSYVCFNSDPSIPYELLLSLVRSTLKMGNLLEYTGLLADKLSEQSRKAGKVGGKKSGEIRRANAAKLWVETATKMASDFRKKEPRLSQSKLVDKISNVWKGEKIPSDKSLLLLIRNLERSGILPRMQR